MSLKENLLSDLNNISQYTRQHPWNTDKSEVPTKLFKDYPKAMKFLGCTDDHYYRNSLKFSNHFLKIRGHQQPRIKQNNDAIAHMKQGVYPINNYRDVSTGNVPVNVNKQLVTPQNMTMAIHNVIPVIKTRLSDFDIKHVIKGANQSIQDTTPQGFQETDYQAPLQKQKKDYKDVRDFGRLVRRKNIAKPVEKCTKYLRQHHNVMAKLGFVQQDNQIINQNPKLNQDLFATRQNRLAINDLVQKVLPKQEQQIGLHTHSFDHQTPLQMFTHKVFHSHRTDYGKFLMGYPKVANQLGIHSGKYLKHQLNQSNYKLVNALASGKLVGQESDAYDKIKDNQRRIHRIKPLKAYQGSVLGKDKQVTKLNMVTHLKTLIHQNPYGIKEKRSKILKKVVHNYDKAPIKLPKMTMNLTQYQNTFRDGQLFDKNPRLNMLTGIYGSQGAKKRLNTAQRIAKVSHNSRWLESIDAKLSKIRPNCAYSGLEIDQMSSQLKPLTKQAIKQNMQKHAGVYSKLLPNQLHDLNNHVHVNKAQKQVKHWNQKKIQEAGKPINGIRMPKSLINSKPLTKHQKAVKAYFQKHGFHVSR